MKLVVCRSTSCVTGLLPVWLTLTLNTSRGSGCFWASLRAASRASCHSRALFRPRNSETGERWQSECDSETQHQIKRPYKSLPTVYLKGYIQQWLTKLPLTSFKLHADIQMVSMGSSDSGLVERASLPTSHTIPLRKPLPVFPKCLFVFLIRCHLKEYVLQPDDPPPPTLDKLA